MITVIAFIGGLLIGWFIGACSNSDKHNGSNNQPTQDLSGYPPGADIEYEKETKPEI